MKTSIKLCGLAAAVLMATAGSAMASEADMPAWGPQDERGIDMEVETAAADLAAGSDAVILRHPESVKTISKLIKALA